MNRNVRVSHNNRSVTFELDATASLADQVAELVSQLEATEHRVEEYILCSASQTAYLTAADWRSGVFPRWLGPNCEMLLVVSPQVEVRDLLAKLAAPSDEVSTEEKKALVFALQKSKLLAPPSAEEFILQDGLPALLAIISEPENEGSGLQAFCLLALRLPRSPAPLRPLALLGVGGLAFSAEGMLRGMLRANAPWAPK